MIFLIFTSSVRADRPIKQNTTANSGAGCGLCLSSIPPWEKPCEPSQIQIALDGTGCAGGCQGRFWLERGEGPVEIALQIGEILDSNGNPYKAVS